MTNKGLYGRPRVIKENRRINPNANGFSMLKNQLIKSGMSPALVSERLTILNEFRDANRAVKCSICKKNNAIIFNQCEVKDFEVVKGSVKHYCGECFSKRSNK